MDGLLAVLTMAGFNILYEKMRFRGKNVQAISPPYNPLPIGPTVIFRLSGQNYPK